MGHEQTPVVGADGDGAVDDRERARAAAQTSQWELAFAALSSLSTREELDAEDLEAFGEAAWWLCRLPECIAARERSIAAYVADGHPRRAALIALRLFYTFSVRAESAIAIGWLRRARRLLENEPDGPEH